MAVEPWGRCGPPIGKPRNVRTTAPRLIGDGIRSSSNRSGFGSIAASGALFASLGGFLAPLPFHTWRGRERERDHSSVWSPVLTINETLKLPFLFPAFWHIHHLLNLLNIHLMHFPQGLVILTKWSNNQKSFQKSNIDVTFNLSN